ncbi:1-aminocyclopropane-1-carboxylate synthase 7 [Salvia divinorum]|uniref:1-aminocyclopropane-1-carboxylate synthase 7 n=1 Tax=Salvia divinorum TaxID=28513 RepID=A0ABD1GU96_SALDI
MTLKSFEQPTVAPAIALSLSKIAVFESHDESSPYFAGWKAYDKNPYDESSNPSGVIEMGLTENKVSIDLFEKYLEKNSLDATSSRRFSCFRDIALFQDYHGLLSFREAMASFMGQLRGGRAKFDPERIVITAGATAANELLTFILADPGDALLIPTPYYSGFNRDLRWRTGVNILPIHCDSSNGFEITLAALDSAYSNAESRGLRVRGILITNPSNPLGATIKRAVLEHVLDFVARKNIHLVSDEIYSGSAFADHEFVSIAEVLEARGYQDSERCHIVYSLSKDLGLSGFRVGTIYSYNDDVVTTARRMSSFTLISSQTQQLLATMLSDEEFMVGYIETNRERLRRRYRMIVTELGRAGIECFKGNAGLFCWVNLSPLLKEETVEEEVALWECILREVRINISPGVMFHCTEPGWFRVCFANLSEQTLQVALARIHDFVDRRRANQ